MEEEGRRWGKECGGGGRRVKKDRRKRVKKE